MRILIREVRRAAGNNFEHIDSTFEGDVVTVGRATDQVIQLHDRQLALSHSEIRVSGRALAIRAQGEEQFFVNGKRSRASRLNAGDVVEIGNYALTVGASADHDFMIEVEARAVSASEVAFGSSFTQSLDGVAWSKRKLSWALVLGSLVAFLFIPGIAVFDHELAAELRAMPLVPDDGLWSPGPMHSAHQMMGANCNACHVEPFVRVRDRECIACHVSMTHHVDTAIHQVPALEEVRCATCHMEHKEPSVLVRRDQKQCADCHADLEAFASGPLGVENASDFEHHHPEFKVSMLVPVGGALDMTWEIERRALDDPDLIEQSNLKFPHDVHMSTDGIEGPAGKLQMACSDCHRPEAGGAYMQPVSMERHCADCHALTFDASVPNRELPHGQPDMVVRLLEEFYSRQVLVGSNAVPTGRSVREARRPGQMSPMTAAERDAAITLALTQAEQTAENIFERTTCAICHEVERVDDPERASPWQVLPVRLARVWMPKGWFDHHAHKTVNCSDCHDAASSSQASDVLMPDIASCRECHGGGNARNKLASDCVDCHVFHLPGKGLMRPDEPHASLRPVTSDLDLVRGSTFDRLMPVRATQ